MPKRLGVQEHLPLLFLGVVALMLLPFAYRIAQPFFTPVVGASVLAIVMRPLHLRVSRWIRRPSAAALLSTVLTILLILLPLIFVGAVLTSELSVAYQAVSRKAAEGGGFRAFLSDSVDRSLEPLQGFNIDKEALKADLQHRIRGLIGSALSSLGSAAGILTSSLATALLAFIILFFFFRDGERWTRQLHESLPLKPDLSRRLMITLSDTLVANVHAVLIVALCQGLLLGLVFWLLGLQSPVTWGTIGVVCSMIPIVGTWLIWAPFAVYLLAQGAYWKAVILALWGAFVVGLADQIVRPVVVRGRVKQNPILVSFSVLGSVMAFGAAGLLLGPVVISLFIAIVRAIRTLATEDAVDEAVL